jgi:stalled ribosome rescue protein Dom34
MAEVLLELAAARTSSQYPPVLHAADERRRVEALARRQSGAYTPSDIKSWARFTQVERAVMRREVLRRNHVNRNLLRDILPRGVNDTPGRPVLTSEERATLKRLAGGQGRLARPSNAFGRSE